MQMKMIVVLAAIAAFAGCQFNSPYDYMENWLIREDPTRPFVINSDVIYVQGYLYTRFSNVPLMFYYAKSEVGNGRFSGVARVFAPLVATDKDFERAMDWYFKYHHTKGRPFTFIGEGECGKIMRAYEEANADSLDKKGLIASYYTDSQHKGFVTAEMVKEIKEAVVRRRFRNIWGREMPDVEGSSPEARPSGEQKTDDTTKEPER